MRNPKNDSEIFFLTVRENTTGSAGFVEQYFGFTIFEYLLLKRPFIDSSIP
jgi:hypothetical protein